MNIGPKILSQSVESLRKIRNSARFLLGNLRDQRLPEELKIPREKLGFVSNSASLPDRRLMSMVRLTGTPCTSCTSSRRQHAKATQRITSRKVWPQLCRAGLGLTLFQVVSALSNFANITLSTLYFDITKDALYCEAENSVERLGIITVMEKVSMTT